MITTATSFFKSEAGESFGVFYPTNYLVALFGSDRIAAEARDELQQNGLKPDDMLVLTGQEFISLSDKIHEDANAWSRLMSQISRVIGTEELQLDHDLQRAREGAAFLAVYCPTQEEGQRLFRLLKHLAPVSMRRYSPYAIDRMV